MLTCLAVKNYRSLLNLTLPLQALTVISGANGSGKSNLYRALRLLAATAQGGVINALAAEGGLASTFWAGPETLSPRMRRGEVPIQGGPRQSAVRLGLGFASDTFGYAITLGLPQPSQSMFSLDPEIKKECLWNGVVCRPSSLTVERKGALLRVRRKRRWEVVTQHLSGFDSLFSQVADPVATPEVFQLRETIRQWRFYDHFATDEQAPARQPQLGTRTPVLSADGRDLAAALQTITEIGDAKALARAIDDAFEGASVSVRAAEDGRLTLAFQQPGLLRPLTARELSDGTLRYLLWVAALLTPRPPTLMVLNEPETSLHPDLLPALAALIKQAAKNTQVWVISHAPRLLAALEADAVCHPIQLQKSLGETQMLGLHPLDAPPWQWPT